MQKRWEKFIFINNKDRKRNSDFFALFVNNNYTTATLKAF